MHETPEDILKHLAATEAHAKEVMDHIYKAMLQTPDFTLSDGTKCKVEAYYGPQVNDDGEVKCGIDVKMDDGSHLEFTTKQTGWGKSFVDAIKTAKRGHRR